MTAKASRFLVDIVKFCCLYFNLRIPSANPRLQGPIFD